MNIAQNVNSAMMSISHFAGSLISPQNMLYINRLNKNGNYHL